jgi:succinyl-diaminopimelate desuccinylase
VRFLQELVRVPTDTPPGNNAPHAERTAELLQAMGYEAEKHPVPAQKCTAAAAVDHQPDRAPPLRRRRPGVALNAHGDVVPPGEGWTHDPYGGEIVDGKLYGRAAAVSKSDFATYTFALRALESLGAKLKGGVELHFTYDEEFGGELGPGWLLQQGLTKPDLLIAAGFSYQVVTAHNGCLQMEVTVHGKMAHAAIPDTGVDALQAAVPDPERAVRAEPLYKQVTLAVPGITHPYLNVGRIEGGTNTNVVPGKVVLQARPAHDPRGEPGRGRSRDAQGDRPRPPAAPASRWRSSACCWPIRCSRCRATRRWCEALQRHGEAVFGEPIPTSARRCTPTCGCTCERGIPAVIYGAGPRTVLESHAKRADEHLVLETCAARPRWWRARCSICSAQADGRPARRRRAWPRQAPTGSRGSRQGKA